MRTGIVGKGEYVGYQYLFYFFSHDVSIAIFVWLVQAYDCVAKHQSKIETMAFETILKGLYSSSAVSILLWSMGENSCLLEI